MNYNFIQDDCPKDFQQFLHTAFHLTHSRSKSPDVEPVHVDPYLRRGMCPKKLHEVSNMAALVHQVALQTGSDVIVDVGSGLVCRMCRISRSGYCSRSEDCLRLLGL